MKTNSNRECPPSSRAHQFHLHFSGTCALHHRVLREASSYRVRHVWALLIASAPKNRRWRSISDNALRILPPLVSCFLLSFLLLRLMCNATDTIMRTQFFACNNFRNRLSNFIGKLWKRCEILILSQCRWISYAFRYNFYLTIASEKFPSF